MCKRPLTVFHFFLLFIHVSCQKSVNFSILFELVLQNLIRKLEPIVMISCSFCSLFSFLLEHFRKHRFVRRTHAKLQLYLDCIFSTMKFNRNSLRCAAVHTFRVLYCTSGTFSLRTFI